MRGVHGITPLLKWTKTTSQVHQNIPQDYVRVAVQQLKLSRSWVIELNKDHEHSRKSTTERLRKKKIHLLTQSEPRP